MKLIKFKTSDGHEIEFICESRNTRHGFAHDATLFINGCETGSASCFYLNRTWESWQYQSVCLNAVYAQILSRRDLIKEDYKDAYDIKRLTKKHAEALQARTDADNWIKLYREIQDNLRNNLY